MRDIKTTLQELVRYYDGARGVGHTSAVITGAENVDECVVIAADVQSLRRLAEPGLFRVMTLSELRDGKMLGRACPMVLDNHALTELARGSLAEISRLEYKIAQMKAVAQSIANVDLYD